jgi:hypothetical protein
MKRPASPHAKANAKAKARVAPAPSPPQPEPAPATPQGEPAPEPAPILRPPRRLGVAYKNVSVDGHGDIVFGTACVC